MSSTQPPPAAAPQSRPAYPQQPEGRSVAFWVALLLGLLLLVSGVLNLILLFIVLASGASSLAGASIDDNSAFQIVVVARPDDSNDSRILRIPIVGAITEMASPVMGAPGGTVSQVRRALRLAERDETIKGVLFDINSPGGGVGDSDEVHRLILKFKQNSGKKVIALFGDVSASGGYYIAAACDKILCRPTTITGSIGVIISNYDISEALEKIGVKENTLISPKTPFKDILSMTRPMRPDEKDRILSIVGEMYERFVDIVDKGRPSLTREAVERLADGSIYSAGQALTNGLVDKIVNVDEAYEELTKDLQLEGAQIVELRRRPSPLQALLGSSGPKPLSGEQALSQMLFQTTGSKFLYFWPGGR